MNSKVCFTTTLLALQSLMIGQVSANVQSPQKPLQFYAGLSAGVNQVKGKRSESAYNADILPPDQTSTFANNVSFSDKKAQYALFAGMSWTIPNSSFFIGPEIYIGRSDTENTRGAFVTDPATGLNRVLQASIQQKYFMGATLKAGVKLPWQSQAYVLLGIDKGQFRYAAFYVPRSAVGLGAVDDLSPPTFSTTKWLNGFLWGIGFEKTINNFQVGADIRFIQYKSLKTSHNANSGDAARPVDQLLSSFKPRNMRFSLRVSYLF